MAKNTNYEEEEYNCDDDRGPRLPPSEEREAKILTRMAKTIFDSVRLAKNNPSSAGKVKITLTISCKDTTEAWGIGLAIQGAVPRSDVLPSHGW